jgi:hypothetical protein
MAKTLNRKNGKDKKRINATVSDSLQALKAIEELKCNR